MSRQQQEDDDDQDDAENTYSTAAEAIAVAAEAATEATKQEDDKEDDENESKRHDVISICNLRFFDALRRHGRTSAFVRQEAGTISRTLTLRQRQD
jgi:hypothetical protein